MLSSVGLEVMNSTNPELNWKTVTKGRRTRKSVARCLAGVAKGGNSCSLKRLTEAALGQRTSSKSENVPIKKRRHLLQSPSSQPWTSLHCKDSSTPLKRDASPPSEEGEQLSHSSFSLECRYSYAGDFSGIELLAAAASMDDDANNTTKEDLVEEDTLVQKGCNRGLNCHKPENSLSNLTMNGCNTDCSLFLNNSATASRSICGSPGDGTMSKVNRQHWDLNTPMDAWEEPYNDSTAGSTSKDVAVDVVKMKENENGSDNGVISNAGGTKDGLPNLIIERQKLTSITLETCRGSASLEDHLQELPNNSFSNTTRESSDEASGKDSDARNSNHVLSCDAHMETSVQVSKAEAILESFSMKLCCSSKRKRTMSEERKDAISCVLEKDYSIDGTECYRSTDSYRIQTKDQDATVYDTPTFEVYEPAIDIHQKSSESSQKTPEQPESNSLKEIINSISCKRPDAENSKDNSVEPGRFYSSSKSNLDAGTFSQVHQSFLVADSKTRNDATMITDSGVAGCQNYVEPIQCAAKLHNNVLPNEDSERIIMEGLSNDGTGLKCEDPSNAGKVHLAIDARRDSNVSQDDHCHTVDGDDLRFQEEYDSSYEDGELRGSFLFSWDDNEFENECVDYESDGRNGDGPVAADHHGSEVVEGGSEESHSTERRSLFKKRLPEGNRSKNGSAKYSLRRHSIKDDSDNNEVGGKGESNAGSGTTVEQSIQMVTVENDDATKRRQLTDRKDNVDRKVALMDEYAPEAAREKLQSRVEGHSSINATDGKDFFLIRQCRSRLLGGSYSHSGRDISPKEYMRSRRPATHNKRDGTATHNKRDGVDQWTYWAPRRRHTSVYQGPESWSSAQPRSTTSDSADKFGGSDFHDLRQTANYWSKSLHRPLRRRSPMDRDDSFGMRRRMPLTRGASSYRGRGRHSQRDGRDIGEDFEPLPDNAPTSVRLPHFLSKRERSFSPSNGRTARLPFARRRSRSGSRACSPRAYHSQRDEHLAATRRHSRSPDFRSEARMGRMRLPFSKYNFSSGHGEGYFSPSRSRLSPRRGGRWVDHTFEDNNLRRQRSPVRVLRGTREFDAVNSSRRFKSDEYLRPMNRPRRFSYVAGYDDKRRGDGGEMMHRGPHPDDGVNVRPFRHSAASEDFETSNLNNGDDVRGTDRRDLPRTQSDREGKRAYKI